MLRINIDCTVLKYKSKQSKALDLVQLTKEKNNHTYYESSQQQLKIEVKQYLEFHSMFPQSLGEWGNGASVLSLVGPLVLEGPSLYLYCITIGMSGV